MKLKILVVILLLQFVFFIGALSAEDNWCCLDDGCYDIPIDEEGSCSEVKWQPCVEIDSCEKGFCYNAEEGICSEGVGVSACEEIPGSVWSEDVNVNCAEGCCKIGNSFSIETLASCTKMEEDSLPGQNCGFDSDITDQQTCSSQAESVGLGACVYLEGVERRCDFITQSECESAHPEKEIYQKGMLCSNTELNTICTNADYTKCDEDGNLFGVYWYDSCDNRENIYEGELLGDIQESWNGGLVQPLDESCDDVGPYSNCGNCDIDDGTICGTYRPEDSGHSKDMEGYTCRDMNCHDAPINGYDEDTDESFRLGEKGHQESWCLFDSFVGYGKDTVGSEHWVAECLNGEVTYESSTYRDQVCQEYEPEEGRTTAELILNDVAKCYEYNLEWGTRIQECSEDSLCILIKGLCTAAYPITSEEFWIEGELEPGDISEEEKICGLKSGERDPETGRFLGGDKKESGSSNAKATEGLILEWNNYCISLGDCGSYINYRGSITGLRISGGFASSHFDDWYPEDSGKDYNQYWPELMEEGEIFKDFCKPIDFSKPISEQRIGGYVGDDCDQGPLYNSKGVYIFEDRDLISFKCGRWERQKNSISCEVCNKDPLGRPCSEYKCMSLGANCEFKQNSEIQENGGEPGETDQPFCHNVCEQDDMGEIPKIETTEEIDEGFKWQGGNDEGVEIVSENEEPIPETTKINFKLSTPDIRTKCKYTEVYSDEEFDDILDDGLQKQGNIYTYNHSFLIKVPISEAEPFESEEVIFYIHCMDYCGNENRFEEYKIKLFSTKMPNSNPPIIEIIKPETEVGYIEFEKTEKEMEIQTDVLLSENKCKYDFFPNTLYADMTESFDCREPDSFDDVTCSKTITGLTEPENIVYIRCENQYGFSNNEDLEYTFVQSPLELEIASIKIIKEGNPIEADGALIKSLGALELQVVTSGGALDGVADCKYKFVGLGTSLDSFDVTGETIHTETITPPEGDYELEVHCSDVAENKIEKTVNFKIDKDEEAPIVVRVFREKETKIITLITNENAQCYYNHLDECFPFSADGNSTKITSGVDVTHSFTAEDTKTYYIICVDDYGITNTDCAVIIRPIFV